MELEKNFEKLEDIIKKLEKNDVGLDEAFSLYSEGIKLIRECTNSIDKVEKQLLVLSDISDENN